MHLLLGLLAACFVAPATAPDETKLLPPGITAVDAAEGWIGLFDGETLYGLKPEGAVKVENGMLVLSGSKPASVETTTSFGGAELVIDYCFSSESGSFSIERGKNTLSYGAVGTGPPGNFRTLNVKFSSSATGFIRIITSKETTLLIKSIKLKPLDLKPIFNGKDLTGWKEIPGHKSKFSVTDKGELNIKDGNGDIQTDEQWDDFVLQIDVISNGDHLNSGVFFRCVPGVFWAGYEAQVRDEWISELVLADGSRVEGSLTIKDDQYLVTICKPSGKTWSPTREVKKIAKDEVKEVIHDREKSVDYGTGGIYNRCPSRKVVSTDRQWYTMTVIAHGNHLAVWVNGYQTADYTDTRKMNENARNGRKDGKGCISLQGHDPTTDLNFKNIRITALPQTK